MSNQYVYRAYNMNNQYVYRAYSSVMKKTTSGAPEGSSRHPYVMGF